MPVYVAVEHARLRPLLPLLTIASAGAVVGTLVGARLLTRIPAPRFRAIVGVLVLALGVYMFVRAWSGS
jgi:uncharacterized membrane protein YfcA